MNIRKRLLSFIGISLEMPSGKEVVIGGKVLVKCADCGRLIKIGGFLSGLHICWYGGGDK